MLYKMIYFSSHKFAFLNLRFSPFYEHFRQLREKYAMKSKNKVHHVNQLIEADLMMYIHMTFSKKNHSTPLHSTPLHSTHSTELFKIFFSLLTLSTAFLQKASGPGKKVLAGPIYIQNPVNGRFWPNLDCRKAGSRTARIFKFCVKHDWWSTRPPSKFQVKIILLG